MTKKEFIGNWEFDLTLKVLSKLSSKRFSYKDLAFKKKLQTGKIPTQIFDEWTNDPDPTEEQFNAIKFILENENILLKSIFDSIKNSVYPIYDDEFRKNTEFFPKLNQVWDLKEVVEIWSIEIDRFHKNDFAFCHFTFDFSADPEHLLMLTFHKERLIGFGGAGEWPSEAIAEELGLSDSEFFDNLIQERIDKYVKLYEPHPKYGKLKPWQEAANTDFLREQAKKISK